MEHITAALGTTTQFEDAVTACAAKLLHNLVVILYNHALAMALLLADSAGVPSIESVLDNGTAGRPPSRASVVRDHRLGPTSSYTGGLVAKDIEALLSSFPQLETVPGIDLRELVALYGEYAESPYTVAALARAIGAHSE